MAIAAFAPAKVNLYLHVIGRRADGYHLVDSLVAFADIGDRITAREAPTLSLEVGGPEASSIAGLGDDNLVLRAARLLAERAASARGAALYLEKNLPVAAGIGGGSSDAAAALRALIALQDKLKPSAARVVRQLEKGGLRVFMVTGDNPRAAAVMAAQAGPGPHDAAHRQIRRLLHPVDAQRHVQLLRLRIAGRARRLVGRRGEELAEGMNGIGLEFAAHIHDGRHAELLAPLRLAALRCNASKCLQKHRQEEVVAGDTPIARRAHEPRNGDVLSFSAATMPIFPSDDEPFGRETPYGTAIKLYEYQYIGERSNIIFGKRVILRRLELLLPTPSIWK